MCRDAAELGQAPLRLRDLANESRVPRDGQGRQSPHTGLHEPDRQREQLTCPGFGVQIADVLHVAFAVPYLVSTGFYLVMHAAVFGRRCRRTAGSGRCPGGR